MAHTPNPGRRVSPGQLIVGVFCALLLVGILASMAGSSTSSTDCSSIKSDLKYGHASDADIKSYYRDCR